MVCEIFRVHFDASSRDLLQTLGRSDYTDLGSGVLGGRACTEVKFSAETHLLESILATRLGLPGTEVLEYLWETYAAVQGELGATLNQTAELLTIAREARQLTINYIGLAVGSPETFPEGRFSTPGVVFGVWFGTDQTTARAQRFVELLLRFRDPEVAEAMADSLEDLTDVWSQCRTLFARRCASLTAFSSEAADVIDAFTELLRIPAFKKLIVAAIGEPSGTGAEFETGHVLGCFVGLGPIPRLADPNIGLFRQTVYLKMKSCRTLSAYRKTCDNLNDAYRGCRSALMRAIREIMKNNIEGVNCTEVFLEFLRQALNANAGRGSLGFLFSPDTQAKLCSNSYAAVLGDVLLELAVPVAQRPQLLEKISLASSTHLASLLPETRIAFFGHQPDGESPELGAAARFFFFGVEAVSRCFVPWLKSAEGTVRTLERLTTERKRHPKGSFQRRMLAQHLHRFKTELVCHRLLAEDVERTRRFTELHTALFEKCVSGIVWLPEHYLIDFSDLHCLLVNFVRGHFKSFEQNMVPSYLRLVQVLISDQYADTPVHVRCKFTEPLFAFNLAEKGAGVSTLPATIPEPGLSRLLQAVLGFFASVETGEGQETGQDKFRYRLMVTKFLLPALERDEYRAAFTALAPTREANDFFGHLLSDLTYFLETVFENIARLAQLERSPPPTEDSATESPEHLRQTSETYLGFGRSYLALFERISELTPEVCLGSAWVRRVATLLNFYSAKLCTKSYAKLKFSALRELDLRPLDFIRDLVLAYGRLGHDEYFKREVLDDARCFDRETLIDIGSTAAQRRLVPAETLAEFERLIGELDEMRAERDHWNQIIADPPEEFLCQLTFDLMTEPVELLASRSVVERKSIMEHFVLNGHYDPFNRTRLEPHQLQPLPELQGRIAAWIAERKRQLLPVLPRPTARLDTKPNDAALYGQETTDAKEDANLEFKPLR